MELSCGNRFSTDRRTDSHGETSIPPITSMVGGIKTPIKGMNDLTAGEILWRKLKTFLIFVPHGRGLKVTTDSETDRQT